jgi:hypothetical protein
MSRLRSLWFESRHLETAAPGIRAELAALDDAARAEVLAAGDRLAAASLMLAQQYCHQAPVAWRLGPDLFRRWVGHGERLATGEDASREAAASYFALAPAALAEVPDAESELWLALARRVLRARRRLGEIFVAESGPLLAELDRRRDRLSTWVEVGLGLVSEGDWDAELLALHFFEATALALPLFAPEDFGAWAALGRAAERIGSARAEFFTSAPSALHRLPEADRGTVLHLARTVAENAAAVGVELYFALPTALAAFPDERATIVTSLAPVAASTPAALADLLPVLRALLEETPAALRPHLVALAAALAARFPPGVVPFYRVLPRLLEHTGITGIERWVGEGLVLAAENAGAGLAYFGLDSRTSRAILAAGSTAVGFTEVQGLLTRYLHMLEGRPHKVAARADVGYRPPLATVAAPGAGTPPGGTSSTQEEALFPPRIDVFATTEANLRLYRLIAAQHAGRIDFGTEALEPPVRDFIARFEYPAIAEHLFGIFEGLRVDAALARAYRGLAADLKAVAAEVARETVRLPGTIPHLARILIQAQRPNLARRLPAIAAHLESPDATVAESAQATVLIYAEIMGVESGFGLTAGPSGFPELFAERSLADAFLDLDGGASLVGLGEMAGGDGEGGETADDETRVALTLAPECDEAAPGKPLDPALLLQLLQADADLTVKQATGADLEALGLYISDLAGKVPRERLAELQGLLRRTHGGCADAAEPTSGDGDFLYDEWDYRIADYRSAWCRLAEIPLESDTGDFFHRTLATHADLLPEIRRQFQRIRPERYRVVHGLEDGEDFDLNAVITARADRRSGQPPSSKLYQARQREERDIATLFLLDMSASTDEPVPGGPAGRRVIDITKEALVVMTEALEGIGDNYGIYGFSGHGRKQVEFYLVKHFNEPLTGTVKGRIGAIEPKRSTRMGPALRHAVAKMRNVAARSKHIILLSDGFPQDLDYGDDRRSNTYGIQDTMMAFQEAARAGVTPFCITVDRAGHDYLKEICEASRYLVIEDITALPRELPKIYQRCVRP